MKTIKGVIVTLLALARWRERIQPDRDARALVEAVLQADVAGDKLTKRAQSFFGRCHTNSEQLVLVSHTYSAVFLCEDNKIISVARTDQLMKNAKLLKQYQIRAGSLKRVKGSATYKRPDASLSWSGEEE